MHLIEKICFDRRFGPTSASRSSCRSWRTWGTLANGSFVFNFRGAGKSWHRNKDSLWTDKPTAQGGAEVAPSAHVHLCRILKHILYKSSVIKNLTRDGMRSKQNAEHEPECPQVCSLLLSCQTLLV